MNEYTENMHPGCIMDKATGIHYTLVGDYYFPTCTLTDTKPVIGKWADLYERYLQEKHPQEYTRLIWSNELRRLLESVQKECNWRLEVLIRQMAKAEGIDEALKAYELGTANEQYPKQSRRADCS